jgi:hypothetical protein
MKRSTKVAAPLLASAALAILAGCRKPEMQRCVDEQNRVVDDSLCANQPNQANQAQQQQPRPMGGGSLIPLIPLYHYYYGGWGGYGLGSVVGGGSYTPAAGRSYATRSGVTTRGGFGSSYSGGSHGEGVGE